MRFGIGIEIEIEIEIGIDFRIEIGFEMISMNFSMMGQRAKTGCTFKLSDQTASASFFSYYESP